MGSTVIEVADKPELLDRHYWTAEEVAEWFGRGTVLAERLANDQWAIAYWLAEAKERAEWHQTLFDHAEQLFGLSTSLLYRMAQVAEAFPISRRRENPEWAKLKWSHYIEVAPIEQVAEQNRLLNEAVSGKDARWRVWPIRHLRSRIKALEREEADPKKPPAPIPEPREYALFERPISEGPNCPRFRVTVTKEEFALLTRLAKARGTKNPGPLVRQLLAEASKSHLDAWSSEIAATSTPKRATSGVKKKATAKRK
jgi:hypothetical protein